MKWPSHTIVGLTLMALTVVYCVHQWATDFGCDEWVYAEHFPPPHLIKPDIKYCIKN